MTELSAKYVGIVKLDYCKGEARSDNKLMSLCGSQSC